MYTITYKGKPATLGKLDSRQPNFIGSLVPSWQHKLYLVTRTEKACKALYLSYFGYTWEEREAGIDVARIAGWE